MDFSAETSCAISSPQVGYVFFQFRELSSHISSRAGIPILELPSKVFVYKYAGSKTTHIYCLYLYKLSRSCNIFYYVTIFCINQSDYVMILSMIPERDFYRNTPAFEDLNLVQAKSFVH